MLGSAAVIRQTLFLAAVLSMTACVPRARMCTTQAECTKESACVAGRCQPDKPNVKPAIDSARRIVVRPVDLAYLRRGEGASDGALPPLFVLGHGGGTLLLRFAVNFAPAANIVEAYLVLRRSDLVDDDPAPIALHATRIVEPWSGRSTSWALQPQMQELRTPSTTVEPSGPPLVRLDVRDLVRQWGRHDPVDQGIGVVAENESRTGTTFALASGGSGGSRTQTEQDSEPYLEVYVR